jgi:hypothetical protein
VDNVSAQAIQVHPDLVDRLLELYCDWRTECATVRASYERFADAPRESRDVAYAAYTSALDRERLAAEDYAAQVKLIALVGSDDPRHARHRTRIRK